MVQGTYKIYNKNYVNPIKDAKEKKYNKEFSLYFKSMNKKEIKELYLII